MIANNNNKSDHQSIRKLNFEDEDLIVEPVVEPTLTDSKDEIHANVLEEVVPKIGMEFGTEQEEYDFYNNFMHMPLGLILGEARGLKMTRKHV